MNEPSIIKDRVISGLTWRLAENFGTQIISFIIQIILARLLFPKDYGIIALTIVFIAIANVFIQTGFTAALIQRKQITDRECSSVFYVGLSVSFVLYLAIYITSPYISDFYGEPILTHVLRLQSLSLLFGGLTAVHNALLTRNMQFKKTFLRSVTAVVLQGMTGIPLALLGFGVWALVWANIVNYIVSAIATWRIAGWRPKRIFSWDDIKDLFPFSVKILAVSFINTVFQNIRAIVIGRWYDSSTLGYYNRGYQIPLLIMLNLDGTINTVMFPVLSKCQDDRERLLQIMRRSLRTSCFIVFPILFGLVATAKPIILLLLTSKWLQCVPYMQITCLVCLFWPFSVRNHALNAIGRSDITFRIEIFGKVLAVIFMIVGLHFNVYIFLLGELFSSLIYTIIGAIYSKKILGYQYKHQITDIAPSIFLSILMGIAVWSVMLLNDILWLKLIIQLGLGISIYITGARIIKLDSYKYIVNIIRNYVNRTGNN